MIVHISTVLKSKVDSVMQSVIPYIYLSNISDISFEQAWKASGLSSNTDDYFSLEEAVLVEMKTE